MKKRGLAMMLAGAMVLGMVPATGLTAGAEEEITLRLAWLGSSSSDKEFLDSKLAAYTEKTGIKVETVFIAGSWSEYFTKIQTMIAGGDNIDCAHIAIEGFDMFTQTGLAASMNDWIVAHPDEWNAVADDVSESTLNKMVFEGETYAVPFEWNTIVTNFNMNRLEEAGLELPEAGWDKAEFLEYCEKLTTEEDGVKKYALALPDSYFKATGWFYNAGATVMNEDFTQSTINSPEMVEVMQFMQDLIYEYGYAPIPDSSVDPMMSLVNGDIAMGYYGRWATAVYSNNNFEDVGIQYVPILKEGVENTPVWGGAGLFTMNTSEHPDEAMDLVTWMASEEFITGYMGSGAVPVLNSVAEEVISSLGYPENYEIYWEAADNAKEIQAPAQYAEISDIFNRAYSDILVNKADVQSTLDAAAAEMDSYLIDNIE